MQDGDHSEGQNTITKIEDRLAQLKSYSRDKLRVSLSLTILQVTYL